MQKTTVSSKINTKKEEVPYEYSQGSADSKNGKPFAIREPSKGFSLKLKELVEFHELIYFLTWRDLKVRYKQTALGVVWAILQPFLTMVVFTIFFGRLAKIPSDGVPYPIFSYAALLPWQLFANGVTNSSNSLVNNSNLITKIYFPRLIMPISSVGGGLIDFCVAFLVLIGMMFYYGITPTLSILTLPFFILLAIATSFSVSLWLSAINVKYRDVRYTIPFLTQIWLFLTPIAYPSSLVPEKWSLIYGLNPMAGVVEGFRWALLGQSNQNWYLISASVLIVIVLLIGGLIYFKRMERTFADII
jgi:lipopolysaccharide transport system permease protein